MDRRHFLGSLTSTGTLVTVGCLGDSDAHRDADEVFASHRYEGSELVGGIRLRQVGVDAGDVGSLGIFAGPRTLSINTGSRWRCGWDRISVSTSHPSLPGKFRSRGTRSGSERDSASAPRAKRSIASSPVVTKRSRASLPVALNASSIRRVSPVLSSTIRIWHHDETL
jgi:hypothetical protein